jgi:alkylhydroperoxidase family enzyme
MLGVGIDMICIATDGAKGTCKPRLLAQALRKSSDSLMSTYRPRPLKAYGQMEMGQGVVASVPAPLKALAGIKAATLIGCPFGMDIGSAVGRRQGVTEQQLLDPAAFETSSAFTEAVHQGRTS